MKSKTDEFIKRIEEIEGRSAYEALTDLYWGQNFIFDELMKRYGIGSNRVMPRIFAKLGICKRTSKELVAVQWERNTKRREIVSEKARKQMLEFYDNGGTHPNTGKNKFNTPRLQQLSEKMKIIKPAARPDVRKKNSETNKYLIKTGKKIHPNSVAKPTCCEQIVIEHIKQLGFNPIHNYLIAPHWIDVFIPELGVGIECFSDGRTPLYWERHTDITAHGVKIIYFPNRYINKGIWDDFDKFIRNLQVSGFNPSTQSKEAVVWGRRQLPNTFDIDSNKLTGVLSGKQGSYRLDITST